MTDQPVLNPTPSEIEQMDEDDLVELIQKIEEAEAKDPATSDFTPVDYREMAESKHHARLVLVDEYGYTRDDLPNGEGDA